MTHGTVAYLLDRGGRFDAHVGDMVLGEGHLRLRCCNVAYMGSFPVPSGWHDATLTLYGGDGTLVGSWVTSLYVGDEMIGEESVMDFWVDVFVEGTE
jgi:hypothetical protein